MISGLITSLHEQDEGRKSPPVASDRRALFQRCLIEIAWGRCRAGHGVTLAARGVN